MNAETEVKCPVPPITDPVGREHWRQPSPVHFGWGDEKVGIPKQLMHQLHRYDGTLPTGSYPGKMFLRGKHLVWIEVTQEHPVEKLGYNSLEYEETGDYDPSPHLEPCPLCGEEAYCGFEAKSCGDLVKFHITCAGCGLTFGNLWKTGLPTSMENSVLVMQDWNNRDRGKTATGGK